MSWGWHFGFQVTDSNIEMVFCNPLTNGPTTSSPSKGSAEVYWRTIIWFRCVKPGNELKHGGIQPKDATAPECRANWQTFQCFEIGAGGGALKNLTHMSVVGPKSRHSWGKVLLRYLMKIKANLKCQGAEPDGRNREQMGESSREWMTVELQWQLCFHYKLLHNLVKKHNFAITMFPLCRKYN